MDRSSIRLIAESPLFDLDWYSIQREQRFENKIAAIQDALALENHPLDTCRYFFSGAYLANNEDVKNAGIHPLLHFLKYGKDEPRTISPVLDKTCILHQLPKVDTTTDWLTRFIEAENNGQPVNPNAFFNTAYFLKQFGSAPHPLNAYLTVGEDKGLQPSPDFDPVFYANTYLDGIRSGALNHYIGSGFMDGLLPRSMSGNAARNVFEQLQINTRAGADYVDAMPRAKIPVSKPVTLIAYYLPQFHQDPINDAAWGEGFTEWTSVMRGAPRFRGHLQPRIPGALGHYDLSVKRSIRRQMKLASAASISCFGVYYYNFGEENALRKPLDHMSEITETGMQYFLIWANEHWSRTWDADDKTLLIEQHHDPKFLPQQCKEIASYMRTPHYFRIDGRPVLSLYKPHPFLQQAGYLDALRQGIADILGVEPFIFGHYTCNKKLIRNSDLDGIMEFPPFSPDVTLPFRQVDSADRFDPVFMGDVVDYEQASAHFMRQERFSPNYVRTVFPSWDNDARRPARGLTFSDSSPALFQKWLRQAIQDAQNHPIEGTPIVSINAWNEWAESAALEPDRHYGYAFLKAVMDEMAG